MQISYRKLKPSDSLDFRLVRLECLKNFPENFGTLYEDEIEKPKLPFEEIIERNLDDIFFFGAFADEELIGIAGFKRENRTKTRHRGELISMYVKPEFHGRKVGENLVRELLENVFNLEGIEQVSLTVVAENSAAVGFYEKLGFETFGVQKNYFRLGARYWDQKFMQLMKNGFSRESG